MTSLEKIKDFIGRFEGYKILENFTVDYTSNVPAHGAIFPNGLVEVSRKSDILGNVTAINQYNFGLYYTFEKSPGDDPAATENADWIMEFQEWIQEQSCTGKAPIFGDVPSAEKITAQNGTIYEAETDGVAIYMVQLSVSFVKKYRGENNG